MSAAICQCKKCKPYPPGCSYVTENKSGICNLCFHGNHEAPEKRKKGK